MHNTDYIKYSAVGLWPLYSVRNEHNHPFAVARGDSDISLILITLSRLFRCIKPTINLINF